MQIHRIQIPIYDKTVTLIICSEELGKEYLQKEYDIEYSLVGSYGQFITVDYVSKGISSFVLWLNPDYTQGTLIHELLHASWSLLDYVGIKLTENNHEAQAYLLDYLYTQVMNITAEQDGIKELIDGDSKEKHTNTQRQEESIQAILNFDPPS